MTDKLHKIFSKTECPSEEILQKYLKDELSMEEKHLLEKHLIDCEICSDVLEGMSLVGDSKIVAPIIVDINSEIKSHIQKPQTKSKVISLNSWIPYVAAAAVILFIVSIFYLRQDLRDNKVIVAEKTKEAIEKETDAKQPLNNVKNELVETPEGTYQELDIVLESELQEEIDLDIIADDEIENAIENYEIPPEAIAKSASGSTAVGKAAVNYSFTTSDAAYQPQKETTDIKRIQAEKISDKYKDAENIELTEVQVASTSSKKSIFPKKKYAKKRKAASHKIGKSSRRSEAPVSENSKGNIKKPEISYEEVEVAQDETIIIADSAQKYYSQNTTYNLAFTNYNSNNYRVAVGYFNLVLSDSINHYNSLYYGGISYYKLNKNDSALIYLNKVLEVEKGAFHEEAMWHKALILKRTNKIPETKLILQSIINENGKYKIQAEEMLKKLN